MGDPTEIEVKENTVLLLRAPKEDGEDLFEKMLKAAALTVWSLPVLSFEFINVEYLVNCLKQHEQYSGIVFTSPRCVQAVQNVYQGMAAASIESVQKLLCYVVGKSTASFSKQAGFNPCGQESGNAELLAEHLVKILDKDSKPLLYPCGNLKKDTLSKILGKNDIRLKDITVYKTTANSELNNLLGTHLHTEGLPEFVVFFSPSGVEFTTKALSDDMLLLSKAKVIAIGPTTQKALEENGIKVYGVAAKPEPQGVLDIILKKR